jgi:2,5-furandicarboxylate decarboxylase 1
MNKDLRTFLKAVKELGSEYYVEVSRPVKPKYETWVLQEKLAREGRFPVIYYPKIEGSKLPVVSNLFGSWKLFGLALGMDPRKSSISDIFHEYRKRKEKRKPFKTVSHSESPVKAKILRGKKVDLNKLPIIHHAVLDSGKYISCGQLVCKDPDTGILNVGIYRMELKGKDRLGCMMIPAQHAKYIARRYADLGNPMEIAVYVGHHPAVTAGAEFTGPIDVCEYDVAGGYLEEPLEVVKGETVDLLVPAHAEIVIEGIIDPCKMDTDGPFAEWTGYYGEQSECYTIRVTAITMRRDAIYHDLADGCWEHPMLNSIGFTGAVYDAVARVVPSVKNVYLPPSGRGVITAYISIAKRIEGEGKRAGLAAINSAASVKIAVVVDEDIDVYNEKDVLWAVATRACPDIDIDVIPRLAGGKLDPTAYDETRFKKGAMTSKMIIDATKPVGIPFPTKIEPPEKVWKSMRIEDYIKDDKRG